MAVELRPATAVLVLVVVLAAGSFGSVVVAESGLAADDREPALRLVPLADGERHIWLYTSRGYSFESATLALNVVAYGDPAAVRRAFLAGEQGDWNETRAVEQEVAPDESASPESPSGVEWEMATGANRYVHVQGPRRSVWLGESYQVHDGTYLGSRHHVRAYTAPGEGSQWTAMQAHHEHWDWFMARHVVTSTDDSQSAVERELADGAASPDVRRVPVGTAADTGFDTWVTVVDLTGAGVDSAAAALAVVFGVVGARAEDVGAFVRERYPASDARTVVLAAGLAGLLAAVRLAGVALEASVSVPPKAFAVALYPVLFVGLPVLSAVLARPLDGQRAFAGATVGFLSGVLWDYSYLGVSHVPLDVLVHRGALAAALGLVAIGSTAAAGDAGERTNHVRAGVLLWLVATLLPLLRHTPLPV